MKPANRNLLLQAAPALMAGAAGAILFWEAQCSFHAAQSSMPQLPGGADVVEGYAFLIGFISSGVGQLAALAAQIIGVLLVLYGCLMLGLGVLARAIYKATPGRLLAYRIVVGVDLLLLAAPVPWLIGTFLESLLKLRPDFNLLMMALLLLLPAVFILRTTYTGRIEAAAAPPATPS